MLTIHHLGVSQSERVVWLMEELGLPYKLVWHQRTSDFLAPSSLLGLHPAAMAPIIEDGDLMLCESEAILPYICQRHGGGRLTVSPEAANFPDYLYWMALSNNLLGLFFAKSAAGEGTPAFATQMIARREDGYARFVEETLGKHAFLAGDAITCADIMSHFFLSFPPMFGDRDMPHTQAYLQRLGQRPAFIKAQEIAGRSAMPPPEA